MGPSTEVVRLHLLGRPLQSKSRAAPRSRRGRRHGVAAWSLEGAAACKAPPPPPPPPGPTATGGSAPETSMRLLRLALCLAHPHAGGSAEHPLITLEPVTGVHAKPGGRNGQRPCNLKKERTSRRHAPPPRYKAPLPNPRWADF